MLDKTNHYTPKCGKHIIENKQIYKGEINYYDSTNGIGNN